MFTTLWFKTGFQKKAIQKDNEYSSTYDIKICIFKDFFEKGNIIYIYEYDTLFNSLINERTIQI